MESEGVGAFERLLVAGELADGVAALAIPDVGLGDGVVIEGHGLGVGLCVRLEITLRIGVGATFHEHATKRGEALGEIVVADRGALVGGEDARLEQGEALETPGREAPAGHEEILNFAGGPAEGKSRGGAMKPA